MPPKDRSITTLSKSTTNSPSVSGSETPIQFVKGVGPRLGSVFNSREIDTVKDLLHFFPRTYEDRSQLCQVSGLVEGAKSTLSVRIISKRQIPIQRMGKSMLEVRCADDTGELVLKWFHPPRGMEKRFTSGMSIIVTGKVKIYMGRPEIIHPEITWGVAGDTAQLDPHPNVGRIVPVYTELEGIPSRTFRKVLWEALDKFADTLKEDLPAFLLERRKLPQLSSAIKTLHFPSDDSAGQLQALADFDTPAHHRLIYGEFFKFEYMMLRRRLHIERSFAPCFGEKGGAEQVKFLTALLPFRLTGGQEEALRDILADLAQSHPMNRLVQGDVGAGKTAIALLTAGLVLAEGGQVALMAPTEILAEQHFKTTLKLFGGRVAVALLTGKTPASERAVLQRRLSAGESLLLIGTHALIEDPVVFSNLTYVMIDEQHRFGVEQRRALRLKGVRKDPVTGRLTAPHSLILTATPIPRTLALTAFGDLAVTSIRELPPGRSPILTEVIRDRAQKTRAYQKIRAELSAGRQAYFIYPLVNDSEAEGFTQLKSAVTEAQLLASEIFPDYSVGLLHGQLSSDEKAKVMEHFKRGEVQVLVSTTVVEVGVDVPNATVMAIEHAERFGLSQLHQLRGRVGRGQHQSYCYLFTHPRAEFATSQRLEVLEETNDGFQIAEADLEIRGPGEFLGVKQAGGLPFRLANLVRDREWLLRARDDVTELMREDPDLKLPKHLSLRQYYEREGGLQFARLNTS
jgi:ATP-dependent DNA helicase RecG